MAQRENFVIQLNKVINIKKKKMVQHIQTYLQIQWAKAA